MILILCIPQLRGRHTRSSILSIVLSIPSPPLLWSDAISNFQSENLFSTVWSFWFTEPSWYWSLRCGVAFLTIYTRNVNIFNIIVENYFYPNYIIRNTVWVSDEKKICIKASLENVRVAQMLIIYTTILNNSCKKYCRHNLRNLILTMKLIVSRMHFAKSVKSFAEKYFGTEYLHYCVNVSIEGNF